MTNHEDHHGLDAFLASVLPQVTSSTAASTINKGTYRPLTQEEILSLEARGNNSNDWSLVQVATSAPPQQLNSTVVQSPSPSPSPSPSSLPATIVRNYFYGPTFLPSLTFGFDASAVAPSPRSRTHTHQQTRGIYDSTLINCVIQASDVLIKGNHHLSHLIIQPGAILIGNGTIESTHTHSSSCCVKEIVVGAEALGGRPVFVHPTTTMQEVFMQALPSHQNDKQITAYFKYLQETYVSPSPNSTPTRKMAIIGAHATIQHCPRVINSHIGPHALLDHVDIDNTTILSSLLEPTTLTGYSLVHNSVVQPGVKVGGHALVRDSFLMEFSSVDTEGKLNNVIACPDSGIATGECHHSLVGPFVGFHHQSLLIAALWPGGRGNVAYGAKIGSNHTGRAADQEALLGEGVFFGLNVVVKLPVNLSCSPYTLIAADTTLEQQRLHFPFSLVGACREVDVLREATATAKEGDTHTQTQTSIGGLSSMNQLRPAWVLSASPYTVLRNEAKFSQRSKARKHRAEVSVPIFRPEIVDLMVEARDRLKKAVEEVEKEKEDETENEEEGGTEGNGGENEKKNVVFVGKKRPLEGIGANLVTYTSAKEAIIVYTKWIKRYALWGVYEHMVETEAGGGKEPLSEEEQKKKDELCAHQGQVLLKEYPDMSTPLEYVQELVGIETEIVAAVEESKRKDEARGALILDDYRQTHPPVEEDKVILAAKAKLEKLRADVERWGE